MTKAAKENVAVRREGLLVRGDGAMQEINLEVTPLKPNGDETCFLILFEPVGAAARPKPARSVKAPRGRSHDDADRRIADRSVEVKDAECSWGHEA